MGSQIKASCRCGYNKESLIGGGLLTYKTLEYFPCYCESCQDMVEGNLRANKLTCPNCNSRKVTPYYNKSLIGKTGKKTTAKSFDNILTDGFYKCPQCNEMTLQFFNGIYWD